MWESGSLGQGSKEHVTSWAVTAGGLANHLTWKLQLKLASAVKREEVDSELLLLQNNIVLTLEYSPELRAWMEDPCKYPAKAAGMELEDNTGISNNTNSATTPCTLGMNTPKLTNDCGSDLADKAALSNNKCALTSPVSLNVHANSTHPKHIPTTQTASHPAASLDCYLVYIVNACQDAVTRIHHHLSAHTTIFHAYYVTHTPGLHC
jgi:hypothetical protein